jgi:hypothetical protein
MLQFHIQNIFVELQIEHTSVFTRQKNHAKMLQGQ